MALTFLDYQKIEELFAIYSTPLKTETLNHSMEQVCDGGFTFSSNRKELPFHTVFDEPENGYGIVFDNPEKISEFCKALSDPEVLKALKKFYSFGQEVVFDADYAKSILGITNPEETLPKIKAFGVLYTEEIIIDGKKKRFGDLSKNAGSMPSLRS